jgi:zinc protease
MRNPITRLDLPNGFHVLLKEIHTSPIVSQWIWYRVGSRDEAPGLTGASHWAEHMQFKGTPKFPSSETERAISREGGVWNAFTFLDWTAYFETMPASKLDVVMRLEADRMVNSNFDPTEVETERTVIISERKGNENDPLFKLSEQVVATAFRKHPYHHMVIGDMDDLKTMQREDLYEHYRKHYVPSNAVLTLSGDFETERVISHIRQLYEAIPAGRERPRHYHPEPLQTDERRIIVDGPGETVFIQIAYHAPAASNPDFFPLAVLDSLLTGPSSLNMFGGGISNKTSRLYLSLVERELAVSVSGGLQACIDPFLYTIISIVHPESSAEQVIAAIDEQIMRFLDTPARENELSRAVKQARALFVYGSESITNQAFWLGYAEMFSTYDWFTDYLDNLASVTAQDVQRVAQTYLRPQNRVIGVYNPTGNGQDNPLD